MSLHTDTIYKGDAMPKYDVGLEDDHFGRFEAEDEEAVITALFKYAEDEGYTMPEPRSKGNYIAVKVAS